MARLLECRPEAFKVVSGICAGDAWNQSHPCHTDCQDYPNEVGVPRCLSHSSTPFRGGPPAFSSPEPLTMRRYHSSQSHTGRWTRTVTESRVCSHKRHAGAEPSCLFLTQTTSRKPWQSAVMKVIWSFSFPSCTWERVCPGSCASRTSQYNCSSNCVPKYNLGTRTNESQTFL